LQHAEFFHTEHFEKNYYRVPPPAGLGHLIDFFWETKFDHLWKQYPKGFSDAQFSNIGYTYIINLGTPFTMQVADKKFVMKTDGFLPRYNPIECFHKSGNHLFGIKFRISPILFEKKINFSEYKGYIFPLSYLLDELIIEQVKDARTFNARTHILSKYFLSLTDQQKGLSHPASIVGEILEKADRQNDFSVPLNKLASRYKISERTLQRYFETCTGITGKQAFQVIRIRRAIAHLVRSAEDFHYSIYGYYDHSHFYKHLKSFLQNNTLKNSGPHLQLLKKLRVNKL
jgi:AraC-like DNA-binding protein